jgi:hypothetical protein
MSLAKQSQTRILSADGFRVLLYLVRKIRSGDKMVLTPGEGRGAMFRR